MRLPECAGDRTVEVRRDPTVGGGVLQVGSVGIFDHGPQALDQLGVVAQRSLAGHHRLEDQTRLDELAKGRTAHLEVERGHPAEVGGLGSATIGPPPGPD